MSSVKVIRVLEYTFSSQSVAERHLRTCEVPLNGAKQFGTNMIIRSSGIINLDPEGDEIKHDN